MSRSTAVCTGALLLSMLLPASASALPRFAARTGADCRLCHVNPSGGGIRTRYGSHVFQQTKLPIDWGLSELDEDAEGSAETTLVRGFSGQLTDWISVGSDVRLSYLMSKPERAVVAMEEPELTSTFFLMQADLYLAARLGSIASLVLDLGVYSGFEAWLLLESPADEDSLRFSLKLGRFLPAFGIRDVNHDLFTRAAVGLGTVDRDTGVELGASLGPAALSLALVNGTLGEIAIDTPGTQSRSFEKALVTRASVHLLDGELLHAQLGASFAYNDNTNRANPLFGVSLAQADRMAAESGVDELRTGPFLTVGFGRLTYLLDLVYVRDSLRAGTRADIAGYTSFQELGFVVAQGIEPAVSVEFMDPDTDFTDDTSLRFGLSVQVFFTSYLEVQILARHMLSDFAPTGDITDLTVFAHAFF